MYDTVAVLIDQPPRSVIESPAWQQERVAVNLQTGERTRTRILNVPSGPSLTLLGDGRLKVERSLPKALTGQNVEDIAAADVPRAVQAVDEEVARAFGTLALPSIGTGRPVRADYCESRRLGSEDAVRRELLRLGSVELPRKGRPVRGESASVSWPKGGIRPKVYSKWLETQGSERAYGVLRLEVGAYRLQTFRALLGLPALAPVALADVLTGDVRAKVMTRYARELVGGVAMAHELTDTRFGAEMLGLFGVRRAAGLLGYAVLWHMAGEPAITENMVESGRSPFGPSRSTHYRVIADYRRLRQHLIEKGYEVDATEQPEDVLRLVQALAA